MKRLEALIAAAIVTGIIALGMLAIGVNALFNPNSVQASNSPSAAAAILTNPGTGQTASSAADQAQINQLQNEISQYQDQLNQANGQLQQMQQVLSALQQRGLIQITANGRILIPRGGFGGGGFGAGGDGN